MKITRGRMENETNEREKRLKGLNRDESNLSFTKHCWINRIAGFIFVILAPSQSNNVNVLASSVDWLTQQTSIPTELDKFENMFWIFCWRRLNSFHLLDDFYVITLNVKNVFSLCLIINSIALISALKPWACSWKASPDQLLVFN